jgi:hypothetical protein
MHTIYLRWGIRMNAPSQLVLLYEGADIPTTITVIPNPSISEDM